MFTPPYLIFYVTGKCNAKCVHCFNWEMSSDDLSLWEIQQIAKKWGKLAIVNLGGGEPYLRNNLGYIVDAFDSKIVAIPSNGILTERIILTVDTLAKAFPKRFFRFTFSIDGIGKEHDKIRGVECFDKVSRTIKEVMKLKRKYKNFTVLTNSCFMQANQNTLLDTIKYIRKEFKVDFPSVTFVRGNSRQPNVKQNIDINKYKEVVTYLNKLDYSGFNKHPMAKFIRNVTLRTREKVIENLETGNKTFKCYAIKKMIVVTNTGEVRICEPLLHSLGNLRHYDYNIKELLLDKSITCDGNCHWECAIRTGLIYNPKEWIKNITYKWASKRT